MIVLDTTVLVYALGVDHPLRPECRRLIEAVGEGVVTATTTVEVIQEFVHVRSRRRSRSETVDDAAGYAVLLAPLIRPGDTDLTRALQVYLDHPRLGSFDALLAATVLGARHLTGLVSADIAFGSVSDLGWIDPSAGDVVERAVAQG